MILEDDEVIQVEERFVFLKKIMYVKNFFLIFFWYIDIYFFINTGFEFKVCFCVFGKIIFFQILVMRGIENIGQEFGFQRIQRRGQKFKLKLQFGRMERVFSSFMSFFFCSRVFYCMFEKLFCDM